VEIRFKPAQTFSGHAAAVYAIASGRSASTFFSASGDRFVTEWNVDTGEQEAFAVKLEQPAFSLCYVKSVNLLFVGNSIGGIHVIDLAEKKEIRYLVQHTNGIYDMVFDAPRNQLIVAGGDGVMSVWSLPDLQLLVALPLITEKLRQLTFNAAQTSLAIASGDGGIRLLDPLFFNEISLTTLHPEGATSVSFHPTKSVILSGGKDAMLRIHSLENHAELFAIPAHNFAIYSIAFNPSGTLFATASRDKTIKIWNATTLDLIERLDHKSGGHSHSVNKLLWMNEHVFLSCSDDRKIIQWNAN